MRSELILYDHFKIRLAEPNEHYPMKFLGTVVAGQFLCEEVGDPFVIGYVGVKDKFWRYWCPYNRAWRYYGSVLGFRQDLISPDLYERLLSIEAKEDYVGVCVMEDYWPKPQTIEV